MDDAIAICFPVVAVVDEKVMDCAKSVEGYSVAKWHGDVEIDRTVKKNEGDVCGGRSWWDGVWVVCVIWQLVSRLLFLANKREGSLWRGGS